jgi:hypothetical protein
MNGRRNSASWTACRNAQGALPPLVSQAPPLEGELCGQPSRKPAIRKTIKCRQAAIFIRGCFDCAIKECARSRSANAPRSSPRHTCGRPGSDVLPGRARQAAGTALRDGGEVHRLQPKPRDSEAPANCGLYRIPAQSPKNGQAADRLAKSRYQKIWRAWHFAITSRYLRCMLYRCIERRNEMR